MSFSSEPSGTDFAERLGCDFVALIGALHTLLDDKKSKRLINVPPDGRKGASRNKELLQILAGRQILTRLDTSLTHFFNASLMAMLGLLDNRYLRLDGVCLGYLKLFYLRKG
jgi:hypothetical protein